jgi:NAD(P)-dependent dehydrogenase (short-subunit alcohol dehydrogenase family)
VERVLITGCSTGIGRATAEELTHQGYEVVATSRELDGMDGLHADRKFALDVTDQSSIDAVVAQAGPIDVLVNNAGISVWGPIETVPVPLVEKLFDTNVFGVVRMTQAVLPQMRERGRGAIVNISSAAGRTCGSPFLGWYGMTKHAIETMSEALRVEVGHLGIRVILLEPGAVDTNFPASRVTAGVDAAPYDTLFESFTQGISEMRSTVYPPSAVAEIIAEALTEDRPKLRWYGSPDAEAIISSRLGVADDVLEARMRERLGIDPL